jgi:3-deoxy-D-manno-octulosonic-acid transferase
MSALLLVAYQILGTILFVAATPYLIIRFLRHPQEMKERLGWSVPRFEGGGSPLWLHAASLGELEAARGLLEDCEHSFSPPILLTVLSVSARGKAAQVCGEAAAVAFAPLDLWFTLWPFLRRVNPRGLLLVETELWPLTLASCLGRRIPMALISGRLSPRKWSATRRLRPLLSPLLSRFDGMAVQTQSDADRFSVLGGRALRVTGNLKYRLTAAGSRGRTDRTRQGRLLFVAGSVRLGEEDVAVAGEGMGLLFVLAPRHLRERDHWMRVCRSLGRPVAARSEIRLEVPSGTALHDAGVRARFRDELEVGWPRGERGEPAVLLLDTHGELGAWFAAADAAFVGGTLVPLGGHNLFEPAREGIPVAFGPHTEGVAEVAEPLLRHGGGFQVRDGAALQAWIGSMAANPEARARAGDWARAAAEEVGGALNRTWGFLESLAWTKVSQSRVRHPLTPTGEPRP